MNITSLIKKVVRRMVLSKYEHHLLKKFDSKDEVLHWGEIYDDIGDEMMCQLKLLEIEGKNTAQDLMSVFLECSNYKKKLKKDKQIEKAFGTSRLDRLKDKLKKT